MMMWWLDRTRPQGRLRLLSFVVYPETKINLLASF
jgi:hypothetical protein